MKQFFFIELFSNNFINVMNLSETIKIIINIINNV